jgi:hypothetical protein
MTRDNNGLFYPLRPSRPEPGSEENEPLLNPEEQPSSSSTMAHSPSMENDAARDVDGKLAVDLLDSQSSRLASRDIANMDPEERSRLEIQLRRKIDYRLLPMVILMYIMNYLDRNNIASARIAGPGGKGIQDELGLTSSQYQTSISILFVGYLIMQSK